MGWSLGNPALVRYVQWCELCATNGTVTEGELLLCNANHAIMEGIQAFAFTNYAAQTAHLFVLSPNSHVHSV